MKPLVIGAAILLFLAPAFAEAKKQKPAPEEEPSSPYDAATREKSSDAITTEDLERMMEERPDVQLRELPPTPPPAPAAKPPKAKPKAKARAQSKPQAKAPVKVTRQVTPTFVPLPRSQGTGAPNSKVAVLEGRVAALEKAILASKNPALPREWLKPPGVPPGNRDTQLRQAKEELAAARQDLARR